MVLQVHLHYFHSKTIDHIPTVTCPTMGDNICDPNVSELIPEIYSLVAIDEKQLVVKAFSREFCFTGREFARRGALHKVNHV